MQKQFFYDTDIKMPTMVRGNFKKTFPDRLKQLHIMWNFFNLHWTIDFGEEIYYIKPSRQHFHYHERYHYHNFNQMQSVSSFYEKLTLGTFPNKIPIFIIHTNGHFLDIKTWILVPYEKCIGTLSLLHQFLLRK